MKNIRAEIFNIYSEFISYVLTMARAFKSPLFIDSLKLLNTTRKYYNDMLSHRINTNDDKEKTTE